MSLEISLLLDGELTLDESPGVLTLAAADQALRDRYTLYGLVGDTLRGNSTPDDGYTLGILERLRKVPAQIEPGFDPLRDE
jgi:negative regulator of sigma E activity